MSADVLGKVTFKAATGVRIPYGTPTIAPEPPQFPERWPIAGRVGVALPVQGAPGYAT
jgi:hypothetical protein